MHIHVCLSELLLGVVAPRSGTNETCVCVVVHVVYCPMAYTRFDKCLMHVKVQQIKRYWSTIMYIEVCILKGGCHSREQHCIVHMHRYSAQKYHAQKRISVNYMLYAATCPLTMYKRMYTMCEPVTSPLHGGFTLLY